MNIHVWRYLENTGNYPGYQLSADREGTQLLRMRLGDPWPKSSIGLNKPTSTVLSIPNNRNGKAVIRAFTKLVMHLTESPTAQLHSIREEGETCHLDCPTSLISTLDKFLADLENGINDYCLPLEAGGSLWIW